MQELPQKHDSQAVAARMNEKLAQRVNRWKRLRIALAAGFAACGLLIIVLLQELLYAVPLFAMAFICLMLYLAARDHLRAIKRRNWKTITPRFGNPRRSDDAGAAKDAAGEPS